MIENVLIIYEEELFAIGLKNIIKEINPDIKVVLCLLYDDLEKCLLEHPAELIILSQDMCIDVSYSNNLVKKIYPDSKFVVLTRTFTPDDVKKFMENCINGAICKKYSVEKIKSIMNLLLLGENYYPPELLPYTYQATLTKQQVKLISELRKGLSNKQIAFEMGIAETTVKAHMSILMKKLNVNNRVQVIKKAMEMGLIPY